MILGLPAILGRILGAGDLKAKAEQIIRGKLQDQEGRTAAKEVAQCLYKSIAAAMHPTVGGTAQQRVAIGMALAQQAAEQANQIGKAIIEFAAAQGSLETARGGTEESIARTAREKAEKRLERECLDVIRAVIGDAPQL